MRGWAGAIVLLRTCWHLVFLDFYAFAMVLVRIHGSLRKIFQNTLWLHLTACSSRTKKMHQPRPARRKRLRKRRPLASPRVVRRPRQTLMCFCSVMRNEVVLMVGLWLELPFLFLFGCLFCWMLMRCLCFQQRSTESTFCTQGLPPSLFWLFCLLLLLCLFFLFLLKQNSESYIELQSHGVCVCAER